MPVPRVKLTCKSDGAGLDFPRMYPRVVTKDPTAVQVEVQSAYHGMFPKGDAMFVPHVFGWAITCFTGGYDNYQAIDAREKGLPDNLAVSLARVAIVRSERLVAELAMELLGDESLARDSIGNAQFKTSMIAGLGGGSVEVQLNTVARALLGPGR